jgi:hypothetical protein
VSHTDDSGWRTTRALLATGSFGPMMGDERDDDDDDEP